MYSKELSDFVTAFICSNRKISYNFLLNKHPQFLNLILEETSFIESNKLELSRRIWHIVNNTKEIPKCQECSLNHVNWNKKSYAQFCSHRCGAVNKKTREKREQSCLEKYGTKSHLQNTSVKEKIVKSIYKKYGVDSYAKTSEAKERKIKQSLEKYGVDHYSKTKEYKEKILKTNIEKCGKFHQKQKHYTDETFLKLNDANWLYQEHVINKKFLIEIAQELGVSDKTVGNYIRKHGFETQQKNFSAQEKELANFVQSIFPDCRLNAKILGRKEVDIFIERKNIAIEYNGLYHHCSFVKEKNYHRNKFLLCQEKGIRLISIYEDEWLAKPILIKEKLLHIFGVSEQKKIYARICTVKEISSKDKKSFLDQYHIQGNGIGSVNIGLFCDDELCAVMSFVNRKAGNFELTRYATKYNIIGGFSKLLSYFKRNLDWTSIVTFADLRWHIGEVYQKNGFILDKEIKEDYEYVINKKRYHKFNYRKNRIKKLYPLEYDKTLSEKELMDKLGIPRIYDCGKLRFLLKYEEDK